MNNREIRRRTTRVVKIGRTAIGGDFPVVLQSMCASKTSDAAATASTAQRLHEAGAGIVRIAVDSIKDAESLQIIRAETDANLSVDLQENYRLAAILAPHVDKIRYNPGHLHHIEPHRSWKEKVGELAEIATSNDCALRIGVNCGSLDPSKATGTDTILASAVEHADFLDSIGFSRFCVSIKSSDPVAVVELNRRFAEIRPDIPLHLGVTEAGIPPEGIVKTRMALEPLLSAGIGETLRVSLTVPNDRKFEEIDAGRLILDNISKGNLLGADDFVQNGLNIVSCPSCSRVENESFVALAVKVREATRFAAEIPLKIAVMGCRVNGPGETDDADIGLWCGPNSVHLKRRETELGAYSYEEIIPKMLELLREIVESKSR